MDIFPVVPGMTLELGKTGTHYVRAFRFDISAWQDAYPDGIINLIHRMPNANEPYVAGYLRLGEGYIDWVVQSSDVAVPGYGECELVMIVDGVAVDKTDTYPTHIEEQLGTNSVTPPTGATWVEQVLTVGNATLQAVDGFEDLVAEKEQDITDLASGKEQNITDLAAQKIAAIEAKGAQTLDSIPEDYTELSGEVTELKRALSIKLIMGEGRYVDYDTTDHTLTFPANTILVCPYRGGYIKHLLGDSDYVVSNITSSAVGTGAIKIFIDPSDWSFKLVNFNYDATAGWYYLCTIRISGGYPVTICCEFPWSVNGVPYNIQNIVVPSEFKGFYTADGAVSSPGDTTKEVHTGLIRCNNGDEFVFSIEFASSVAMLRPMPLAPPTTSILLIISWLHSHHYGIFQ